MERVTIRVPATTANLAAGFDVLGCALGLYNTLSFTPAERLSFSGCDEQYQTTENLAYVAYERVWRELRRSDVPPVHIHIQADIPVCRGLGSSAALIAVITIAGILALAFYYSDGGRSWSVSVTRVSDALTYDGTEYDFSGDALLGDDRWAILISEDGQVIWSFRRPADVPEQYSLTDVASFTRWYLGDYPVQCRIRDDGLLVVAPPRGACGSMTWP